MWVDCNRAKNPADLILKMQQLAAARATHDTAYARSFSWPRLPKTAMLSNEGRPCEPGDAACANGGSLTSF